MASQESTVWEYMMMPFKRYSEFGGRSRRREFWSFQLFSSLVSGLLVSLITMSTVFRLVSEINLIFTGLLAVYWFIMFIPSLAVTVRRLHDIGYSGWWILLLLLPYLGAFVLIVLMLLNGQRGVNAWGNDPKETVKISLEDHLDFSK